MRDTIYITHNCGFFSNCSVKLDRLLTAFIRTGRLLQVDSSKSWGLYNPGHIANNPKDDITFHFFLRPEHYTNESDFSNTLKDNLYQEIHKHDKQKRIMRYLPTDNQFADYTNINYSVFTPFIHKYFTPTQEILDIKYNQIKKYNLTNYISVYYRGTDKVGETKLAPYETFAEKIRHVQTANPECQLLVLTDTTQFMDFIKEKFPNVIYFEDNQTSSDRAIHGMNTAQENYDAVKWFVANLLVLSEGSHIICSSGNCSIWMMYYRNNPINVHQFYMNKWHE